MLTLPPRLRVQPGTMQAEYFRLRWVGTSRQDATNLLGAKPNTVKAWHKRWHARARGLLGRDAEWVEVLRLMFDWEKLAQEKEKVTKKVQAAA